MPTSAVFETSDLSNLLFTLQVSFSMCQNINIAFKGKIKDFNMMD